MKIPAAILVSLLVSLGAAAQDGPPLSAEQAAFRKLTQLAALAPGSEEFDQAWTGYVVRHIGPDGDVDAVIDRVIRSANDFRQEFNAGRGGSGGPALAYFEMRALMREIANRALGQGDS